MTCRPTLAFFVVFLASIQCMAVALALGQIPLSRPGAFLVLVAAAMLGYLASRYSKEDPVPEGPPLVSPGLRRILLTSAFVIVAGFLVLALAVHDMSYDGNSYHTPPINQWLIKGYIHDLNPDFAISFAMNGFPKGTEAVTFVFVRAFGPWILNGLNFFYAPLGFFGIAVLCQLFGATAADSLIFGAAWLIIPANLIQYDSLYVDSATGSSIVALLALLASNLARRPQSWLLETILIGCAMGNAIGAKGTATVICAVSMFSWAVWALRDALAKRRRFQPVALILCLSILVATATGGYWYIKNYVRHGSPLYPVGLAVAGHTIWPGMSASDAAGESTNTPEELRGIKPALRVPVSWLTPVITKPWNYPWRSARIFEADTRLGSLGAIWIAGCVPALLLCAFLLWRGRFPDPGKRPLLYFLAMAVFLAFFAVPENWWGRYTLWLFALGLPACWLALRSSQAFSQQGQRVVRIWSGATAAAALMGAIFLLGVCWIHPFARIKVGAHHLPYLAYWPEKAVLPLFPEMQSPAIHEIMNGSEPVGVGPENLGFYGEMIYGQLATPVGRRWLVPVTAEATESDSVRLYRADHLKYILWLAGSPVPAAIATHFENRGAEGRFECLQAKPDSFR